MLCRFFKVYSSCYLCFKFAVFDFVCWNKPLKIHLSIAAIMHLQLVNLLREKNWSSYEKGGTRKLFFHDEIQGSTFLVALMWTGSKQAWSENDRLWQKAYQWMTVLDNETLRDFFLVTQVVSIGMQIHDLNRLLDFDPRKSKHTNKIFLTISFQFSSFSFRMNVNTEKCCLWLNWEKH